MVDGASLIGGAFLGVAGLVGGGGLVAGVVGPAWCFGVVAVAPGWAVGGW